MSSDSLPKQFVVIRPYRPSEDEVECKALAREFIMSSVWTTFLAALLRETSFQLMVFLAAIMFIVIGIPFQYCITSVPLTIGLLYGTVWATHLLKAAEIQQEIALIKQQYLQSDKTGFWVAELFCPMFESINASKMKATFVAPSIAENMKTSSRRKQVVGFAGIQRSKEQACIAWLRRLVVTKEARRLGIATELLATASSFCYDRGYSSIETSVTECQENGKEFLLKNNFELEQLYHKKVMGSTATYCKYLFRLELKHTKSALNA